MKNPLTSIAEIGLLIAVASFFFGIAITSIALALVSLCTIVFLIFKGFSNNSKPKANSVFWTLPLLYALILIREAFFGFENWADLALKYVPFLIFPVYFSFLTITSRTKRNLATVYIFSAFASAVVNSSYAIYRGAILSENVNLWYFTYNFLAEPFSLQPIYLALFYVFALILLVRRLKTHWAYWLVFILLLINLFLLSARNAIITAMVLLPIYFFLTKELSKKTLVTFMVVTVGAFAIALQTPVVKNRISKATRKGNFFSGTSLRYNIWSSAIETSRHNFVFGSGKRQGRTMLVAEFKNRGLKTPVKYEYHAHNQFLAFLVEYGLIGVLLLSLIFIQLAYAFLRSGELLGFFWLLIIFLASITETLLTRQWGILYFALFASYFWNISNNQLKSETNTSSKLAN